jgi:hypothetical protein
MQKWKSERNAKSEKARKRKSERGENAKVIWSQNYQNIAVSLGGSLGVSHEIRSLIEVYLGSLYVP